MLSSPLDDGSTDSQSNIYTSGPLSSANSRFAPSAGRPAGPASKSGWPLWPVCLESLPILLSDLARVHPGRPAALPTATGWDAELLTRTAGVRLPRPGHSESSIGRIHPYVRSCSATGTDKERSGWRT